MVATATRGSALVFVLAVANGCYWSNPPTTPHGHKAAALDSMSTLSVTVNPVQLQSSKVIVLGRFDSVATQPIGGLYDFAEYEISPLIRTYYFGHAHLELFEHVSDALRASGLDVRKDYATTAEPALLEKRVRDLQPFLVRATVQSLQHDQIRSDTDPAADYEAVQLVVDVSVLDVQGAERYRARHTIEARMVYQQDLDVLRILGLKLGERLTRDAGFLRAVAAHRRGAS
jgi:hypothetical protein